MIRRDITVHSVTSGWRRIETEFAFSAVHFTRLFILVCECLVCDTEIIETVISGREETNTR